MAWSDHLEAEHGGEAEAGEAEEEAAGAGCHGDLRYPVDICICRL